MCTILYILYIDIKQIGVNSNAGVIYLLSV